MVDFLPVKTVFDDVRVKMLFGLQQQRARAAGGVVNLVDAGLAVHGELGNQLGDMLWGEELAARFARVGRVVGNEEFVGIAKEVDVTGVKIAPMKITKIQLGHTFEHSGEAGVLVFDGIAKAVAGGVEIGKQSFDVLLRRVAIRGGFYGCKDGSQVGIQTLVGVGLGRDLGEELAGVDEVALGLDGVVFNVRCDDAVGQLGIVDAVIIAFDVGRKVFTDEAVKQAAEHVLLKVPAIDGAAHIVRDLPDAALQFGALLNAAHSRCPVESFIWFPIGFSLR